MPGLPPVPSPLIFWRRPDVPRYSLTFDLAEDQAETERDASCL